MLQPSGNELYSEIVGIPRDFDYYDIPKDCVQNDKKSLNFPKFSSITMIREEVEEAEQIMVSWMYDGACKPRVMSEGCGVALLLWYCGEGDWREPYDVCGLCVRISSTESNSWVSELGAFAYAVVLAEVMGDIVCWTT